MSRRLLLVTALLTALVTLVTWPQVLSLSAGVNDFGDPLLNSWALAWVAHTLPAHPGAVFNANIFYPEPNTLAYSETLLLPGLLVAPILWLGGDPILAHNLLLLVGYIASGVAMFILVRSLTDHDAAALVAAVVFALYPYRYEQYAHVQLQLAWWLPLALWMLHRIAKDPSWKLAVPLGLLMAAQLYSGVYLAIEGSVVITLAGAGAIAASPGRWTAILRQLTVAFLVLMTLSLPLARAYTRASHVVGERALASVGPESAVPGDYLRANPDNALYGNPRRPGEGERRLFPGVLSPALALVSLLPPSGPIIWTYAACTMVTFDLSLGTNVPGYSLLYRWFPPLRAMRVPARFGMLFGLTLSVLAGFGMARLCRRRSQRVQVAMAAVAVLVVVIESRPHSLDLSVLADPRPAVYTWLATQPPGVVCEYPVGQLEGRAGPQDATYMYYSTRHWHPLVNGFSGFEPPSYQALVDRLRSFPSAESIEYLRGRGVTYLLVHSSFYIRGDFAADIRALRSQPGVEWLATFHWKPTGETEVFTLRP